jgi:hypothetical protein
MGVGLQDLFNEIDRGAGIMGVNHPEMVMDFLHRLQQGLAERIELHAVGEYHPAPKQ